MAADAKLCATTHWSCPLNMADHPVGLGAYQEVVGIYLAGLRGLDSCSYSIFCWGYDSICSCIVICITNVHFTLNASFYTSMNMVGSHCCCCCSACPQH